MAIVYDALVDEELIYWNLLEYSFSWIRIKKEKEKEKEGTNLG